MKATISTDSFRMNNEIFSDISLVVAGGDSINSKSVHDALGILNRKINYPIQEICGDGNICFLYYHLLNNVHIFKCVSKMVDDEDSDEDSDEIENDGRIDFPYLSLYYSCIDKNLSLTLNWSAVGFTDTIAMINVNLQTPPITKWILHENNLVQFRSLIVNDQQLINCLNESVNLIPTNDPLITSPYHLSDLKIGINGFGHIGQLVFQCALEQGFQVVGVNDPFIRADNMIYMFQNNSTRSQFKGDVSYEDGKIVVNGQQIVISTEREPSKIPWNQLSAEYVIESTGLFTTIDECQPHIQAGAKKVIIAGPSNDAPMFVMGVNEDNYTGKETVICNASCTTNCLAPLAKVIHKKFGIVEGLVITVRPYIPTQQMLDNSSNKDCQSGRIAAENIIASSSGTTEAVEKALPDLNGKLIDMVLRIPTSNVSFINFIIRLNKGAKYEEICAAIKEASNGSLRGILGYIDDEVVSTNSIDYICSSIFDAKSGISFNDNFVKLVLWYNNEYGYSNRVIDLIKHIDVIKYITKKDHGK